MNRDTSLPTEQRSGAARIVVVSTVMLSLISFWRGAAIVLSDLASSAFYVGGVAEQAIGRSAPWFVLGVMLFSFAVRSVYMESCSMFVRGGVYVVVRNAMGAALARLSVSASGERKASGGLREPRGFSFRPSPSSLPLDTRCSP